MFSGIIEELAKVKKIEKRGASLRLTVQSGKVLEDIKEGDSISVNGVCLTVVHYSDNSFSAEVSPETLRSSNLSGLTKESRVNLERSLKLGDRLMGHMVSGHIDGTGVIKEKKKRGDFIEISIEAPGEFMKYIVKKGSVALDGISLTVSERSKNSFRISVIPYTAKMTTLGFKGAGDSVNLECDIVGKYVESFLQKNGKENRGLSREFLKEHGFI